MSANIRALYQTKFSIKLKGKGNEIPHYAYSNVIGN